MTHPKTGKPARTSGLIRWAPVLVLASGLALAQESDAPFAFVDAEEAGLDIELAHGGPEKRWIAEANGSGAAALDYDRDGWMDLVIVNGSTMDHLRAIQATGEARPRPDGVRLFRNLGNGRFRDTTASSGLVSPYWGTGVNAADFDGDGDPDIVITSIGRDLLFENRGSGKFRQIQDGGLSETIAWHTGSTFGDYDGDGDLDLYIAGYVDLASLSLEDPAPVCTYRGIDVFCGPQGLPGAPDHLYRNDGSGRFTDVTESAGLHLETLRHGFTPIFADLNSDGRPDLFVSNDSDANLLFVNQGDGTFVEEGLIRGVAYSSQGNVQADMGAALGDFDKDGDLDVLTTTFSEDYFPIFKQESKGWFVEDSSTAGLKVSTLPLLGWACGFSDFDNDSDLDLWIMNGHVYPGIAESGGTEYQQPLTLFENRSGRLILAEKAFADLPEKSFRSGLKADFDNDGRIDLLALPVDGSPVLLFNRIRNPHHWIGFRLVAPGPNSALIGATVQIEYCGKVDFLSVYNGGSYLSRSDPRLHVGLGTCSRVDRVTVRHPDGTEQIYNDLLSDRWTDLSRR